jgi:hypothetical protein
MGRVLRSKKLILIFKAQRKGGSTIYKSHSAKRVAPARFRTLDFSEKQG